MRYRLLGQTGLYVSELCLGTMTYGGNGGIWEAIGNLQQDAVNEQVKFAVDAGINFIDTANVYSTGKSESLLGESLKMLGLKRDQLIVATKATGSMDDSPNGRGQSRHHLFNQVDASLKRLQLDYIDLYQLAWIRSSDALRGIPVRVERSGSIGKGAVHRAVQHGGLAGHEIVERVGTLEFALSSSAFRPTTPSPAATSSANSCP